MKRRFSHQKKVEERRDEAIIRQESRDNLNDKQQLNKLDNDNQKAVRERKRLNNKIEKKLQDDRKKNIQSGCPGSIPRWM